jgi:hypothetical protein
MKNVTPKMGRKEAENEFSWFSLSYGLKIEKNNT